MARLMYETLTPNNRSDITPWLTRNW